MTFDEWWKKEDWQPVHIVAYAEKIWNASRLSVLEELEAKIKDREGILVYGEKKFLDTVRMEEVKEILSLLAQMKKEG